MAKKDLVHRKSTLPAAPIDYAEDAGAGMEGADSAAFAIPFLSILQSGSPQVKKSDGAYIKGAEEGHMLNSVTGELFREGVDVIPVAYQRRFLRWGPRDAGGGYRGEFTADEIAKLRAAKEIVEVEGAYYFPEGGKVNTKKCDRLADTRNHFVIFVRPDGSYGQALMSLTSTQIKKSKNWMSKIDGVMMMLADGRKIKPASWANRYRARTVPEKNDKGTWFGWAIELVGAVTDADLYAAAKHFHSQIVAGAVKVAMETATATEDDDRF